jgi:hypothetical protein
MALVVCSFVSSEVALLYLLHVLWQPGALCLSLHRSVGEVHRFDGVKSLWSACSIVANRFVDILNGTSCVFICK